MTVENVSPMQALRILSNEFQTSRPLAELRRPVGLPLPEVWLAVPVTLDDLREGQVWPPNRGLDRRRRMREQHDAWRGDWTRWLPNYPPDVSFAPIASLIDDVRSIMLASDPAADEPEPLRTMIRRLLGAAVHDMILHGRTVAVGNATELMALDIRYTWPLYGIPDGWATVTPMVTPNSGDGDPDAAEIAVFAGGNAASIIRRLDANDVEGTYGTLGPIIAAGPAMPAMATHTDRSPVINGWGTPHADRLIPIAVTMARRESGADYALDRFEVPHYEIAMANADAQSAWTAPEQGRRELTAKDVRDRAPTLLENDVLILWDGYSPGKFQQAQLQTSQALSFLNRLDQRWTQETGQIPMEQADSGDVPSGVAYARRQARLVARSREFWAGLYSQIARLLGRDWTWPYVDTALEVSEDDPPEGDLPPDDEDDDVPSDDSDSA